MDHVTTDGRERRGEQPAPQRERLATAALRLLEPGSAGDGSVAELAALAGLSCTRFQKEFTRWAGVSPTQYQQPLLLRQARAMLQAGESVLRASWATDAPDRGARHDSRLRVEAVGPGEFERGGAGLELRWGLAPSPFGPVFLAAGDRGIVALEFVGHDFAAALERLRGHWPRAGLRRAEEEMRALADAAFAPLPGRPPLTLLLRGSDFRIQLWRALLALPPAHLASYGALAAVLGRPGAARAVGAAVGANPVAWLIPCHRVVRANGALGGFRWGLRRKQAMLVREAELENAPAGSVAPGALSG